MRDKMELNLRLKKCNDELTFLVNGIQNEESQDKTLNVHLANIIKYYQDSYYKASNSYKANQILNSYQAFISNLKEVQNGTKTREEATTIIKKSTSSRVLDIAFHNIAKVLELCFWATATFICASACTGFGLPLIFSEPLIGLAITLGTGWMMWKSAEGTLNCFTQFKSTARHNEESKNEISMAAFFKPNTFFKPNIKNQNKLENELEFDYLSEDKVNKNNVDLYSDHSYY